MQSSDPSSCAVEGAYLPIDPGASQRFRDSTSRASPCLRFWCGLFPGLTVASPRRKRLSAKSLNAFLVDPQQRKAFPVIARPLPWVSPSGEKYIASKVPGSEEKGLPCRQPALLWQVTRGPFFPPFLSHGIRSLLLSFKLALRHSDSSSDFLLECTLTVKGFFTRMCCPRSLTPEGQTKTSMLGRSFTDIPTCLFLVTFG